MLDSNGFTPLMYAVQQVYFDGVKKLVDQGADFDVRSKVLAPRFLNPDGTQKVDGSTALHMACMSIDNSMALDIARFLVYKGADTRIKSLASCQTPLFTAAYYSKTIDDRFSRLAELMIKNGTDINSTDCDGNTILHYAVENRRSDWLKDLLGKRFGALVNREIKNNRGLTASMRAKELGLELMTSSPEIKNDIDFEVWELPVPIYGPRERDPNGLTGAMIATIKGDISYINKLIEGDTVLDEQSIEREGDQYGYTALHLALLHERLPMIKALLAKGAHPELRDKRGLPFFHRVFALHSLEDRKDVVDMVARRSSLNIQDAFGNTLLHHAVLHNDADLIKYLLTTYKNKILATVTNNDSDTPADLARKNNSSRKVLIALGQLYAV